MAEKTYTCPWCGDILQKGQFHSGGSFDCVKSGEDFYFPITAKELITNESGIYVRTFGEVPVAYACRTCRKIVLPF